MCPEVSFFCLIRLLGQFLTLTLERTELLLLRLTSEEAGGQHSARKGPDFTKSIPYPRYKQQRQPRVNQKIAKTIILHTKFT